MERKIDAYFQKWKYDVIRKPLIVYGAKQIGKTYTVLKFGEENYTNIAYFNTDNNIELYNIWIKKLIIKKFSIYFTVPFSCSSFTASLYQNNKVNIKLSNPVVIKGVVKSLHIWK